MALHQCADRLEQGEDADSLLATLEGLHSDNPWLVRRRGRLMYSIGQQCERRRDWDQALVVYARSDHPEARVRQVRVLERSEQWDRAQALALELAASPANAQEQQALARMLPRLARKLGGPPQARRRPADLALIELQLPIERSALGVEEAVRLHRLRAQAPVTTSRTPCSTACSAFCAGRQSSPRYQARSSTPSRPARRICTTATSSNDARRCSRPA